ncbi:tyrosine-type recombinase/integrase [Clostridium sp.]|uniref:tyrosine-type recombinase/integrase n=1 Tax=Clostridium sp. TaxID=1506 RepID=UPI001A58B837|nr:tyrosine-type recombinase/integrase [Clostridium sp.]MBK5242063.1 tyrosine-type recombinase/integrase [Clostridium sp.]
MSYINGFKEYLQAKDKSINTVSCYVRDTKVFINWYEGRTDAGIEKVIELDLVEYKKHLQGSGEAVITINRKLASINAFLKYLKQKDIIKEVMAVGVIKDKDKKQYKGLEDKELWKLRNEIHRSVNKMHICIIEVLLQTGIRVSELVGIKLNDIKISDRKGSLQVIGKGNAKRTVPLNKDARKAIEKYLEVRQADGSDYLFIGQRGAIKRNAVNLILESYGDRLQIKVTPHMIRHTLGYNLVRNNTPITTIQQIFGHESIITTNLYTATPEDDKIKALEGLEW